MEGTQKNKMAETPMKKLLLKMGLPMIISMVLQALYNVVDSIFDCKYYLWIYKGKDNLNYNYLKKHYTN